MDIAPAPDGVEENPYHEILTFAPIGDEVASATESDEWGIVQSPFMRARARTVGFRHRVVVDGDTLAYEEATIVDIYGRRFEHTDTNTLTRG